jgi:hypothetical protein
MAPRVERKLTAILAADVVGYSRLMGEDEAERTRGSGPIARTSSSRSSPSTAAAWSSSRAMARPADAEAAVLRRGPRRLHWGATS